MQAPTDPCGALVRGMGETTYGQVREGLSAASKPGSSASLERRAGGQYTTAEMVRMEREIIAQMQAGNRRDQDPCWLLQIRIPTEDRHPELNTSQPRR